jgi:Tat protein translocase TatC
MSDPARRLSVVPPGGRASSPEAPGAEGPEDDVQLTLIDHLRELRKRIIYSAYALVAGFALTYAFSKQILAWVMQPVYESAPKDVIIAFNHPVEAFFVYMRVAAYADVVLCSPFILYQFYKFVAPGLYRRERRLIVPFVSLGVTFFLGGGLFGRYIILPFALQVLIAGYVSNETQTGVAAQTSAIATLTDVSTSAPPSGAVVTFGSKSKKNDQHGVRVTVTTPGPAGTAKVRAVVDGQVTADVNTGASWTDPNDSGIVLDFSTKDGNFALTDVFTNSGLLAHSGSGKGTAFVASAPGSQELSALTATLTISGSGTAAGAATSDSPLTGLGSAKGTLILDDKANGPRVFTFLNGADFPATFTDPASGAVLQFTTQAGPFVAPDAYSITMQPVPHNALHALLSIEETSDFVLMVLVAFGLIFELPLVLTLLARMGIVSSAFLAKYRRHAIVLNVIIAAVVTPTGDAFNLTLMAVPLMVFYELGIIGARFMEGRRKDGDGIRMKDDEPEATAD